MLGGNVGRQRSCLKMTSRRCREWPFTVTKIHGVCILPSNSRSYFVKLLIAPSTLPINAKFEQSSSLLAIEWPTLISVRPNFYNKKLSNFDQKSSHRSVCQKSVDLSKWATFECKFVKRSLKQVYLNWVTLDYFNFQNCLRLRLVQTCIIRCVLCSRQTCF